MNDTFDIYHDQQLTLCIVGHSMMAMVIYQKLKQTHVVVQQTLEQLAEKPQSWFDQYQFIVPTADIVLKRKAVEFLQDKNAHFFSLVNKFNNLAPDIKIGQGTYIDAFNSMMVEHIQVGNHVIIGTHNTLGHYCDLQDYSYIAHHGFFNKCKISVGTVIGTNVMICPGADDAIISIFEYSNIISMSRITKSISQSGTYYNGRKIDNHTSLTKRIL
jgi:UDP-3-O-[3-hydroxymyristoyl] glucosamine N-acyltransferase